MKHQSFLLAAALLFTTGAAAQNVIVLMNDGSSRKFNADYLKEITFTDASDADAIQFSTLSVEAYSGGNASLSFASEDGSVIAVADIYGPSDAVYLNEGSYEAAASLQPFTLDTAYSSVTLDGKKSSVASGSLNVAIGEKSYTCELTLTTTDGTTVKGVYNGTPASYTPWLDFTISGMRYNANEQEKGNYYISFWTSDIVPSFEGAIILVADVAEQIPEGVYTFSDSGEPFTFSPQSYFDQYRPNANTKFAEGSKATVEVSDKGTKVTLDAILMDGRTVNATFDGKINGTPLFKE